jgi:hypothetical protein
LLVYKKLDLFIREFFLLVVWACEKMSLQACSSSSACLVKTWRGLRNDPPSVSTFMPQMNGHRS